MPPPSALYDSAGPRRLFLDYVDLGKADPQPKLDGQISLIKRGKRATAKSQEERRLESWEVLPLLDPNVALLRSEPQPPSLPHGGHVTLEPVRINAPSLPPSSPLASSLQDNDDFDEADPFGFLAAEKKLQHQKHLLPCPSFSESLLEEDGSFGEEEFSGKAFASQTSENKHIWAESVKNKRAATHLSPSHSVLTNGSNDPSSPCWKAVRRRSTTGRKTRRVVGNGKDKDKAEHSQSVTLELDDLPPKRSKRKVQKNGSTKPKVHRTSRKRAIRQSTKTENIQDALLSHLTDEERKVSIKFERDREERLAYYSRVDAYRVTKENVWVV
ncbi:hypothetical protein JB92DRAFT_1362317 [Gautieria morchelliformis]|nr:hypothetical protein JB92DRAFT_1362317 [Gautieria morchelliformis]